MLDSQCQIIYFLRGNFMRKSMRKSKRLFMLVAVALMGGLGVPVASVVTAAPAAAATSVPVVVVGGLVEQNWQLQSLAHGLSNDGDHVFTFALPGGGTGDIGNTARSFSSYIGQVESWTGSSQVDIVAHSEGGLVARYWMKNLGGATHVRTYISLATPQYGTVVANLLQAIGLGNCIGIVACQEMAQGSQFLNNLNANPTPAGPHYITIATYTDEAVQPVWDAQLPGAQNIRVQDWCWNRTPLGHLGMLTDGTVLSMVVSGIDHGWVQSANCWAWPWGGPL